VGSAEKGEKEANARCDDEELEQPVLFWIRSLMIHP